MTTLSVAAADTEPAVCVSSSSVSVDGTKSSPALQSSGTKTNSGSQPQTNLPPRLQKKQRKAEEENYMKYYKPMDYMRQSNSYHSRVAADVSTQHGVDNTRQNGSGSARHVRDVNSRGSVTNRTLWTDDLAAVTNGRSSAAENVCVDSSLEPNMKTNSHQSNAGDTGQSDNAVCEQRPPTTILTSTGNKLPSLEAGLTSLSIQSSTSNHMTSQPSHISSVSVMTLPW